MIKIDPVGLITFSERKKGYREKKSAKNTEDFIVMLWKYTLLITER